MAAAALGVIENLQPALPAAEGDEAKISSEALMSAVSAPLVSDPIVHAVAEAASKQYANPKASLANVASGAELLSLMNTHIDTTL